MPSDVRYCSTSDGVRIAYTVEGDGPPLLFCHYVYPFSLSHLVPEYDEAVRKIGRGRRLIRYDMRGTGLSQRDVTDVSPAATLGDVEAVADALELSRFALLGAAVGGARTIEYASRHSDRVSALVLYDAFARLLDAFPRQVLGAFAQLSRANWPLAARTMADVGARPMNESDGLLWAQLLEKSLDGEIMALMMEAGVSLDVTDHLAQIKCPTLVCHARNDPLWSFELGQKLAESIPNARFVPLEGHEGGPFTNARSAVDAIDSFLREVMPRPPEPRKPRTPRDQLPLTPRELEILHLIVAGHTSKEMSRDLSLSVRTVGRHITNIYDKIGARGRADATAYALQNDLTED